MELHETNYGKAFFGHHIPELINQLKALNKSLEESNEIRKAELEVAREALSLEQFKYTRGFEVKMEEKEDKELLKTKPEAASPILPTDIIV